MKFKRLLKFDSKLLHNFENSIPTKIIHGSFAQSSSYAYVCRETCDFSQSVKLRRRHHRETRHSSSVIYYPPHFLPCTHFGFIFIYSENIGHRILTDSMCFSSFRFIFFFTSDWSQFSSLVMSEQMNNIAS
jgi:hypothetical protein